MSSEKTNELNRILVVDDTAADRSLFKYVLTRAGFVVGVAVDGADALTILAREEYDVVLCDYQMPNVDGYEFLLKVRQNPKFAHVIVIIITSDESDETKVKLMRAGANDFVHKGDSHDEIIKRMRVHLSAQAGQANRKTLELTCAMADNISQPLSVIMATLYVLKDKIDTDMPPGQKEEFLHMVATISKEADNMVTIAEDIKRLSMDTRSSFEKGH